MRSVAGYMRKCWENLVWLPWILCFNVPQDQNVLSHSASYGLHGMHGQNVEFGNFIPGKSLRF